MNKPLVEPLITIGYDEDGDAMMQMAPNLAPAAAVVMLEQMRLNLIGQFRFKKGPKVVPAPAMNGLRGKAN